MTLKQFGKTRINDRERMLDQMEPTGKNLGSRPEKTSGADRNRKLLILVGFLECGFFMVFFIIKIYEKSFLKHSYFSAHDRLTLIFYKIKGHPF